MTDDARIVREALDCYRDHLREIDGVTEIPDGAEVALTALETELATAQDREAGLTKALAEVQADLERAREEGSRLLAEVFNQLTTEQKNAVSGEVAVLIGRFMVDNGYRLVFTRWYLQAPPRAALAPEQKGE